MNKLTLFQTIAYQSEHYSDGIGHFINDIEFFGKFFDLTLAPNANVLDVGINIGIHTEMFLSRTNGKIYGFEASEKIYDFVTKKFSAEPRVRIFHAAISNESGTARFIDTDQWGCGSLAITLGMRQAQGDEAYEERLVPMARLDDLLSDTSDIGLIKMDIEGAELLALEGASRLISRNRPFIVMEYCHNALSFVFRGQPITNTTLRDYAAEIGYVVYNLYGICLTDLDVWNTSIFRDTSDVFLIPKERHDYWVSVLLPKYQYHVLDKISEIIEWETNQNSFFLLTSLPSRVYEIINTSSSQTARARIAKIGNRLRETLKNRNDIFATRKLSRRGEVLVALIYDGAIDLAYELGSLKDVSADRLRHFERAL